MIILWGITLCATALFAYMTLKQSGIRRFIPGSTLAGIALITYVASIFFESAGEQVHEKLVFFSTTLFVGAIIILLVAGIILFIHTNSETL
ncbi:DUF3917 domain-containing protein [Bacillus cereus group sp. BfR-BA-01380]|uniref:DUF3917 domain-containing protein n=1 Tax=Bacillus cereus group sp. BfR-BA-01380 TaxID=2920324 RepID=UPI001F574EF5|nr:DUF3917 domain-containing protein [Bacillus cereus group sp. BfR-BA-01380]